MSKTISVEQARANAVQSNLANFYVAASGGATTPDQALTQAQQHITTAIADQANVTRRGTYIPGQPKLP